MTTNETRTAPIDPRIPALVHVLRDGTDEQVIAAYYQLIGANGMTHGHELWDAAMREAYPGTRTTDMTVTERDLVNKLRGIDSDAAILLHGRLAEELGEAEANALWERATDALIREEEDLSDGPVHDFFGLTYSSYQVVPRVLAQSMPREWQARFVKCMEEMETAFGHLAPIDYDVQPAESVYVNELTKEQMKAVGIFCIEDSPEGSDGYYDRYGNEIEGDDRVMVPVPDPLPPYSRGRTRVPRADQLATGGAS